MQVEVYFGNPFEGNGSYLIPLPIRFLENEIIYNGILQTYFYV